MLCRLRLNDIAMAKAPGFRPDTLPDPVTHPEKIEYDPEAVLIFGEQLHWEYRERNAEDQPRKRRPAARR